MAFLFDPLYQAVDASGLPLSGATLTFYRAGTTSKINIWQNSQASTPMANPVTADAAGKFPPIFHTTAAAYKFMLQDANGVTVQTVDRIPVGEVVDLEALGQAVNDAAGYRDETQAIADQALADIGASKDDFYRVYLGAKASDPALDNSGNALQDGATYWNTSAKVLRYYDLATNAWYSDRYGFAGAWNSLTPYTQNALVEYGGSLWVALRSNTGVSPVEGADWMLFLPGVTVADGAITAAKINGSDAQAIRGKLGVAASSTRQVASGFLSARFLQLPGYRIRLIAQEYGIYNAFPGGLRRFGSEIVAIYSSGAGHGVTDRQRYVRSSDRFQTFDTGTFLLNSSGAYDNSFLVGLLGPGASHNFKSVFTVKDVAGVLTNYTTSVVTVTDPYALWGTPVFIGDRWYTTGYRTSGGYRRPALFQSTNGMQTWSFVVVISANNAKELSETAIVQCANGDWLAIMRNDTNPGDRALDVSRSTNGGATWSAAVTLANMKGVQPHLLRMSNGDIILFCGDRTGSSGLDNAGNPTDSDDITGIAFWKSTDNGLTWSDAKMLAPSWSTDCGQPVAVELDDGTVGVMCYLAPGNTSGNRGIEAGVYWIEFDPRPL